MTQYRIIMRTIDNCDRVQNRRLVGEAYNTMDKARAAIDEVMQNKRMRLLAAMLHICKLHMELDVIDVSVPSKSAT